MKFSQESRTDDATTPNSLEKALLGRVELSELGLLREQSGSNLELSHGVKGSRKTGSRREFGEGGEDGGDGKVNELLASSSTPQDLLLLKAGTHASMTFSTSSPRELLATRSWLNSLASSSVGTLPVRR